MDARKKKSVDKIISLLRTKPPTLETLSKAYGLAIGLGYRPIDIELALRHLKGGDTELALKYLYGPTDRGTGKGAIADFEKISAAG